MSNLIGLTTECGVEAKPSAGSCATAQVCACHPEKKSHLEARGVVHVNLAYLHQLAIRPSLKTG